MIIDNQANKKIKIAVFTGTRAEYGLLYWLLKGINKSDAQLQLLVGGMHLSPEFGYTAEIIENDGFNITEKLEFLLSSESPVGISKSLGLAVISASEALDRNKPDVLVILGDRYEALAVAQAAMIARIPIAHIHGGELTQALIDDSIRHAITKMAHLHFTSTDVYQQRVIQLGEQPDTVYNVGAPGLDNIRLLPLLDKVSLEKSLSYILGDDFFLVTYHPVTLVEDGAAQALNNLLLALDDYPKYKIIITFPNADTFGRQLINILKTYQQEHLERVLLVDSLGQLRYLSAMKLAKVVIGNSSSGIIEAPSCHVPTVNIGDRQKGRISSESVLHCQDSYLAIAAAIRTALTTEHQQRCMKVTNPYGQGDSSEKIVSTLLTHDFKVSRQKVFYDLPSSTA